MTGVDADEPATLDDRRAVPQQGIVDDLHPLLEMAVTPPGDQYKRHAYSEMVRLNNPSGSWE